MKYVYPAIFTQEDKVTLVSFPDLPGAITEADNLPEALIMAKDAAEMWLEHREKHNLEIPSPSTVSKAHKHCADPDAIVSLIAADTDEYRRQNDVKAVKKTLSIPAWLNYQAERANAPFSQILQQGLKEYLKITRH